MLPERPWETATGQRRRRRRRWRLTPRFYRLLAAFVTGYVLLAYWQGYARIAAVRRQIDDVRREIAVLEIRNRQLRQTVAYLSSDAYVERVAREKLGLVRPGETRFVLGEPAPAGDPAEALPRAGRGRAAGGAPAGAGAHR